MNPEQRLKLTKAFLMNRFPGSYQDSWLKNAAVCSPIADAIEFMDGWGDLNLNTLNADPQQFGTFFAILNKSLRFTNGTPPIPSYQEDELDTNMQALNDFVNSLPPNLPNSNYTTRKTQAIENKDSPVLFLNRNQEERQTNFEILRKHTLKTLLQLAKQKMPALPALDVINLENVTSAIKAREELLKETTDPVAKENLESEIDLLKDIAKVAQLSIINIPKEDGSDDHYCILPDAAGGVTEKYSLMSKDKVVNQMVNLYNSRYNLNFDTYTDQRDSFKLSTQGILKLPKHGKTIEVQREAIALNISRILGFTTTKSTMVEHNGKAALFVPFDKIQLMKEYARGETHHVVIPSSLKKIKTINDPYLHYSTVVPVGNQLHSDRTIEDFGKVMAFSYLCNDPDFIGMDNQNKAIKDNQFLYIFDQVVMSDEKMGLDTRLSLSPTGIGRHSRHNQGRNRSIVEDSSFTAKFNSVAELLGHHEKINFMLDNMFFTHFSKISALQASIKLITDKGDRASPQEKKQLKTLKDQLKEVETLKDDVLKIKGVVHERMQTMFRKFPTLNGQAMSPQVFLANQDVLRQSLILEKLVNKPVLFADDGRPYKNPWTYRNKNKISAISLTQDNKVELTFKDLDVTQMVAILKSAGVDASLCERRNKTLIIPVAELNKLNERCMFPELGDVNPATNYLDIKRLKLNLSGYSENSEAVIARIEKYQIEMIKYEEEPDKKVEAMQSALFALKQFRDTSSTKGMVKQVELNLQLDIQQKLRAMIADEEPGLSVKIAQAFDAAVKLDRVNDFNHILMAFAHSDYRNADALEDYLDRCIGRGQNATNYQNAKDASLFMREETSVLYKFLLKKPEHQPVDSVSRMLQQMPPGHNHGHILIEDDDDEVEEINVQGFQENRQSQEHREIREHVSQTSGSKPNPDDPDVVIHETGTPIKVSLFK